MTLPYLIFYVVLLVTMSFLSLRTVITPLLITSLCTQNPNTFPTNPSKKSYNFRDVKFLALYNTILVADWSLLNAFVQGVQCLIRNYILFSTPMYHNRNNSQRNIKIAYSLTIILNKASHNIKTHVFYLNYFDDFRT